MGEREGWDTAQPDKPNILTTVSHPLLARGTLVVVNGRTHSDAQARLQVRAMNTRSKFFNLPTELVAHGDGALGPGYRVRLFGDEHRPRRVLVQVCGGLFLSGRLSPGLVYPQEGRIGVDNLATCPADPDIKRPDLFTQPSPTTLLRPPFRARWKYLHLAISTRRLLHVVEP